ncbi:hypothetical protein RSAG8_02976, partial [Rhizoctonia solani AG-8 WAC10335]
MDMWTRLVGTSARTRSRDDRASARMIFITRPRTFIGFAIVTLKYVRPQHLFALCLGTGTESGPLAIYFWEFGYNIEWAVVLGVYRGRRDRRATTIGRIQHFGGTRSRIEE